MSFALSFQTGSWCNFPHLLIKFHTKEKQGSSWLLERGPAESNPIDSFAFFRFQPGLVLISGPTGKFKNPVSAT